MSADRLANAEPRTPNPERRTPNFPCDPTRTIDLQERA